MGVFSRVYELHFFLQEIQVFFFLLPGDAFTRTFQPPGKLQETLSEDAQGARKCLARNGLRRGRKKVAVAANACNCNSSATRDGCLPPELHDLVQVACDVPQDPQFLAVGKAAGHGVRPKAESAR